jgi:hypothetical protein
MGSVACVAALALCAGDGERRASPCGGVASSLPCWFSFSGFCADVARTQLPSFAAAQVSPFGAFERD